MVIASSTTVPRGPLKWRRVASASSSEDRSTAAVTGHQPLAPLAIMPIPRSPSALLERLYAATAKTAPAAADANRAVTEILGLYIDFINGSVFRRPARVNPGLPFITCRRRAAGIPTESRVQSPESRESESRGSR